MPRYLICYDIADNRRRYRVDRLLKGAGLRAQKSVFECEIAEAELGVLRRKLARQIDPVSDRIHIYRLCGKDESRMAAYGGVGRLEAWDYKIV